jgi:hypothetical protein
MITVQEGNREDDMAVRHKGAIDARRAWAGRLARRARGMLAPVAVAGVLSVSLAACGSAPVATVKLSVSSGPAGTVVQISGTAGKGCVLDKNWLGFDFERFGPPNKGPVTQMTTPVATNGSWSAIFEIPSYLGASSGRGPAASVAPGRYQVMAPTCEKGKAATAAFTVTTGAPGGGAAKYVGIAVTPDGQGYWLAQADGSVNAYGDAHSYGSLPAEKVSPATPIVGMARTYSDKGYWLVGADGHVYDFGDARSYGSLPAPEAALAPVTGMAVTPDGLGYWLLSASGHVYAFGPARSAGSPRANLAPYDAIGTRNGGGYVVTAASDGAVYLFPGGTLSSYGPGSALSGWLVGTAVTPSGNGTWEAGMDGGVITSGDAKFYGSVPSINGTLKAPVTAMAATPDGLGYWLVGGDGAVFSFGDAHFFGSPVPPS